MMMVLGLEKLLKNAQERTIHETVIKSNLK
jgi:hypothetical protein